jgi:heme/copper-type cytochrome/quinol oxidase subunit 4
MAEASFHSQAMPLDRAAQCTLHKTAIELNNIAVNLLVRRYPSEAMDTLKDALLFMSQAVILSPNAGNGSSTSLVGDEIKQALARAWYRSAFPKARGPSDSKRRRSSYQVISSQSNPLQVYDNLMPSGAASRKPHVVLLMIIEAIDFEPLTLFDAALHSGVMTYNYGIILGVVAAATAAAAAASSSTRATAIMAYGVIQHACGALLELDVNSSLSDSWDRLACDGSRLLLVRTISMHHVIKLAIELQRETEYYGYCLDMAHLWQRIYEQKWRFPASVKVNHAGAA